MKDEKKTKRQLIEELQRSQERYRKLFDFSNDGIFLHDLQGKIIDVNQRVLDYLQYSRSEILALSIMQLHPPEVLKLSEAAFQQIIRDGYVSFEIDFLRKDGSFFPAEVSSSLFEIAGEKVIQGIVRDITERQKVREALKESEESYRRVVENIQDALLIDDVDGRVVQANDQFLKLFGFEAAELDSLRMEDFVLPKWHGKIRDFHRRRINGEKVPARFEFEGQTRDGRRIWLEAVVTPVKKGGEIVGTQSILRDVTERKQAEKILRQNEQRYRALFDFSPSGILLEAADGTILDVNPALCRSLKYRAEELIGQKVHKLVHRENIDMVDQNIARLLTGQVLRHTVKSIRRDGTICFMELNERKITLPNGEEGILSIAQDISEHKILEEQFRQAQKMEAVGRLAGGIAHDFNNLLTVIRGYSELILNRLDVSDPIYRNIKQIDKAGERAESLTRQLLAFSRKQILQPRVLNLNELIRDMEKMLLRLIGEDVRITMNLDSQLGHIKADRGQIEQVIMNLIVNARDAMSGGGTLTLETANVYFTEASARLPEYLAPGYYALLSISDTGIGMSKETQLRIFEPFFTTKPKGEGTGLGLSTVYGIVKQSGGSIWVQSEVGKGSTFKIYLPIIEEEIDEESVKMYLDENLRGDETILIVEDEDDVRNLTSEILSFYGYSVLKAKAGNNALKITENYPRKINLILTDVVMPQMSGYELVEKLKPKNPNMKVVYMSGYNESAIVKNGELREEIEFIQKPFLPIDLVRKIREVLNINRADTAPAD